MANSNPGPQVKIRPTLLSVPSLADTLSVSALSIPSLNSAFTSYWLEFDFCDAWSQGPSSWFCRTPWVLRPGLPGSVRNINEYVRRCIFYFYFGPHLWIVCVLVYKLYVRLFFLKGPNSILEPATDTYYFKTQWNLFRNNRGRTILSHKIGPLRWRNLEKLWSKSCMIVAFFNIHLY